MDMTLNEFIQQWQSPCETMEVCTSGSTGQPKHIIVKKSSMIASARMTCDFLGVKKGDKALICLPMDYIAGKMMAVRSLVCGLEMIERTPDGHPLKDVDEVVDFAAMIPLQVYNSLNVPEELEKLKKISNLIIGGGPVDDIIIKKLQTFPNAVWLTYGMTETLSHIALRKLTGKDASDWYIPFKGVEISVRDDGRLVIFAPKVNTERLVTNDIAELSKDGKGFKIIGRVDNVINTGGIKVQMEDVENRLSGVLNCPFVISKRQDKKFGEVIVLVYESNILLDEKEKIEKLCNSSLPKYLRPKFYLRIDKIPMTPTGKPNRIKILKFTEQ